MDDPATDSAAADGAAGAVSGLTDELLRRLSLRETAPGSATQGPQPSSPTAADHRDVSKHPRLYYEERHDAGEDGKDAAALDNSLILKWRQKEKLKTTAVALVLCLNIGVDPPDVIKISPCARLECWVDPNSMQPARALEAIGKNLQAQYERWQPKAKYKTHLDPTVDDVKKLVQSCRRNAKGERVLFHYNGHGVPRPTANGELWVFNARYTQYIPLSVFELQTWLGTPAIYVLDCSSAGMVINSFRALMEQRPMEYRSQSSQGMSSSQSGTPSTSDPMREIIVLAACGAHEVLPQSPELPADVFTACLTTPIKVALRWFASRSLLRQDGITKELIDKIPGRQTDRKTPLGELNWIFTAITDTIAWNMLPRALFQKLFRSDLLVASLFRNFLLAERIMTATGCTPSSLPRLPPTHQHPMWQAWDMAAEMCLMQLPTLLSDPAAEFQPSPFFSEQLTAFELWLSSGSKERAPPEQLPIVLQVLLSQVHRLRALVLLGRFLDMGSWAVDLALSVGIFPYVLKLLQTTSQELRATLVFIWSKILALDKSCQVDLVKDAGHIYFIRYLDSGELGVDPASRAQATFVLSVICDGHPKGQTLCANNGLLNVLLRWLRTYWPPQVAYPSAGHLLLLKWLCLCLGKLCQDNPEISLMAIREGAADLLVALVGLAQPEVRAAAVFGLGCLIHAPSSSQFGAGTSSDGHLSGATSPLEDRLPAEQLIANAIRQVVYDPSVLVRCELAVLYARYVKGHAPHVLEALLAQQKRLQEFARQQMPQASMLLDGQGSFDDASINHSRASDRLWRTSEPLPGSTDTAAMQSGALPHPSDSSFTAANNGALGVGGASPANSTALDRPQSAPSSGNLNNGHAANAANRGGVSTVYASLVESIQLLALDPSPKVAALGRQVLRCAHCEISFVGTLPGVGSQASGALSPYPAASNSTTSALGNLASKFKRPGWVSSRSSVAAVPSFSAGPPGQQALLVTNSFGTKVPATSSASNPAGSDLSRHSMTAGTDLGAVNSADGMHPYHSMPSTPSHCGSPTSPSKDTMFSRPLYVLSCKVDAAGNVLDQPWPRPGQVAGPGIGNVAASPGGFSSSAASPGGQGLVGSVLQHGGSSMRSMQGYGMPGAYGSEAGQPAALPVQYTSAGLHQEPLPQSRVYRLSCEAFARPLLEPGASCWSESAGNLAHWTAPVDPKRRASRLEAIGTSIARCRQLTQPKLREQVYSVDTHGGGLARVTFHPYHNLLVCADTLGYIRVLPYDAPAPTKPVQMFHVSNGAPPGDPRGIIPTSVTYLQHINEADGPMLLAGSADGAVRIWRGHTVQGGGAGMSSAMQAVTINLPPGPGRATSYAWHASRAQLYAAGGAHPDIVYCWDIAHEMCCNMINTPGPGHSQNSNNGTISGANIDGIYLGVADPNMLLTQWSDATLRLFDVRTPRSPVLMLAPFKTHLAGLAMEPAGRSGMIVAASEKGELVLLDTRAGMSATAGALAAGSPTPGILELSAAATTKTVMAHSKGGVSALAAHSVAPLIATGTTTQVVKVWTEQCEAVGAIRAHSAASSVTQKSGGGGVNCMVWHPYQPLLASGGCDNIVTVYAVDQAAGSKAASGGL